MNRLEKIRSKKLTQNESASIFKNTSRNFDDFDDATEVYSMNRDIESERTMDEGKIKVKTKRRELTLSVGDITEKEAIKTVKEKYPTFKEFEYKKYTYKKTGKNGEFIKKIASPELIEQRWQKKKDHIRELSDNISKLKNNITRDLKSENEKDCLSALIIAIMLRTGERIGNKESATYKKRSKKDERKKAFGVSVFLKKHATIVGNKVHFDYIGKKGVPQDKSFSDEKIAKSLSLAIKKSPNEFIFTTSEGQKIHDNMVNKYLKDFNISCKAVRGYSANKWVTDKLKDITPEDSDKKRKKQLNKVLKTVAGKVGHGPSVLKNQYLMPEVVSAWIEKGEVFDIKEAGYVMAKGGKTQLEIGIEVEKEHKDLYERVKNMFEKNGIKMPISETEFYKTIAKAHIKEDKYYYDKLLNYVEGKKEHGGEVDNVKGELKFNKLFNNLFVVTANTQEKIAKTFVRVNEYLDSEEFKGKIFTLDEVKQYFIKKQGAFTYYKDFKGFNIPDYVVDVFLSGKFDPLSEEEKWLMGNLKNNVSAKPYYVIGYVDVEGEEETRHHELGHALYYLNPKYKEEVNVVITDFWRKISPESLNKVKVFLKKFGYDTSIWNDEMNAYLIADKQFLISELVWNDEFEEYRKTLSSIFDKYYLQTFGQNFSELKKIGNNMKKGGLIAPNGKPTNLTSEQYKLVRTPEFKAWFGDWENSPKTSSRVVDSNGEPLVVYHGSFHSFTKFERERIGSKRGDKTYHNGGFYFSDSIKIAESYKYSGGRGFLKDIQRFFKTYHIKASFLNIRNPEIIEGEGRNWDNAEIIYHSKPQNVTKKEHFKNCPQSLIKAGVEKKEASDFCKEMKKDNDMGSIFLETDNVARRVFERGKKDGVIFKDIVDTADISVAKHASNIFVVFHSNQIKLADGSNTTFDVNNSDIRYKEGGIIREQIIQKYNLTGKTPVPIRFKGDNKTYFTKNLSIDRKVIFVTDSNRKSHVKKIEDIVHVNGIDIKLEKGGEIETIVTPDGSQGGIFKGVSHAESPEGGMPTIVNGTGQRILVEGDEALLVPKVSTLKQKVRLVGKTKSVLSKINEMGDGASFSEEEAHLEIIETKEKGGKMKKRIRHISGDVVTADAGAMVINKKNTQANITVDCVGTPQGIASAINEIDGNGVKFGDGAKCKILNKNETTNKMETGNKKRIQREVPQKNRFKDNIIKERGGVNDINVSEIMNKNSERIDKMVDTWTKEGRSFSNINDEDSLFFERIGIPYDKAGTTSQTGIDIVYYDTNIYQSGHNALRGIKYAKGGKTNKEGISKDTSNYAIICYNTAHGGTTQNKGFEDAVKLRNCGGEVGKDVIIVKGSLLWIGARVKGVKLENGEEVYYDEYDREYFTEKTLDKLRKIMYKENGDKYINKKILKDYPISMNEKGGVAEETKKIYWTLPQVTPVHNQPRTNIIIERNEKPIGELGHTGRDLYLYKVYMESPDGNKYWITPSLTEDKAKIRAEELKYTIESGYKVTELVQRMYSKK